MADNRLQEVWAVLLARNIVSASPPQPLGSGNIDRRSEREKQVYLVGLRDGSKAKLTIGKDLTDLAKRSRTWAEAFPVFSCSPIIHVDTGSCSALLESFFDGLSLEQVVSENALPFSLVHRAFFRIASALDSSRTPSTDAARAAEWESWSRSVCALRIWNIGETSFLQHGLLPALAVHLFQDPPQLQWVHGDLIDRNLLLDSGGNPCLIDTEFVQRTHFFPAEISRFYALSASASEQPGLFAGIWPKPASGWELFFWLNQVLRETEENSDAYIAKWLPQRLGMIRFLGENVLDNLLPWPWGRSKTAPSETTEAAELHFASNGRNPLRSVRLPYRCDRPQTLIFPVNEPLDGVRFKTAGSVRTTICTRVAAHSQDYAALGDFSGTQLHPLQINPLGGTTIKYLPSGIAIAASNGDPQVTLTDQLGQKGVRWLEIELVPEIANKKCPAQLYRLEVTRWNDQPSSSSARVSGWCVSPNGSALVRIEAQFNGKVVATSSMQPRPDVQHYRQGDPAALFSGFELEIIAIQPADFLELIAISESGLHFSFEIIQAGDFSNRSAILTPYPVWAKRYDPDWPPPDQPTQFSIRFSILLPVFDPPLPFLQACLESVRNQHFDQWELCVVDDASTRAEITDFLERHARVDTRIRLRRRPVNGGISLATNDALSMATGDFIVLLDHDDVLRPHALLEIAREISAKAFLDVIYSDEDKIAQDGQRLIPFLKPAYSPEYLLAVMYPGHVLCVRRTIANTVRGFDPAFDGIQDYEFFLRITEHTQCIGHLPRILYHWRQSPRSSALEGNVKGDMDKKQVLAVCAHLRRRGDNRRVFSLSRHRLELHEERKPLQRIAILLAWSRGLAETSNCDWNRLLEGTEAIYAMPSVILPSGVRPVVTLAESDWAHALQRIASSLVADIFVIFTAPPSAISEGWSDALAGLAARSDSGCVAPLLISREGLVFEAGRTHSSAGSHPIMCGFNPEGDGYNGSLLCDHEVSAVSPLCAAVRADLVSDVSEASLADWIKFCERLRSRGLFNRICPRVRIQISPSWRQALHVGQPVPTANSDAFFNAQFDSVAADFTLAVPSRNQGTTSPFLWHLDTILGPQLPDGCLTLRGWCFHVNGEKAVVTVTIAGISWSVVCNQPRIDVATSYRDPSIESCGFTVNLKVAAGDHLLGVHVNGADGLRYRILRQHLVVPLTASLRRWLWPRVRHRATFQLMAVPSTRASQIVPEEFPRPRTSATQWPRFTIVTPSFQQRRFLAETMRSVINQRQVHCDYVIHDGGSTDGSVDLIQKEASHLFAWESVRDNGQADAIDRAFRKTSGSAHDVMAWLNSDDFYLPGTLAYVADYFASHPDVDVVYGHRVIVDADSKEVGRWLLPGHDPELLHLNDYVPQETLFWRRRIWDKVGGIDPSLKFAMDWDLLLRLQAAGAKIVRVPYFLACFRIHSAQKTSAQMESIGQNEINTLRLRTFGRALSSAEIESHPCLIRYLRKSAWIEFLWRTFGIRHP